MTEAFTLVLSAEALAVLAVLISWMMRRIRDMERERNRLLGGFTHEVKNALTGAVGMGELLANHLDDLDGDEIAEYAAMAVREGREAVALTEDLLTMQRAEAERLDVAAEPVDLVSTVGRVVETLHGGIPVEADEPGPLGLGDPVRIRQIVRNLLSNAERHGGEQVRVAVDATDTTAIVRVADSGDPIPEDHRERMFDAYQRSRHQARHAESVGLGLTISRHLARLMGGDLEYRHEGGWSVFELTVPRAAPPEEQPTAGSSTPWERIWLGPDGILRSRARPGARVTLEGARAGVEGYINEGGGERRPLLVYAEDTAYVTTEARHHYARSEDAARAVTAVAILVDSSPVARTLADLFVWLTTPPFPCRLFDDEAEAVAWLLEHGDSTTPEQTLSPRDS